MKIERRAYGWSVCGVRYQKDTHIIPPNTIRIDGLMNGKFVYLQFNDIRNYRYGTPYGHQRSEYPSIGKTAIFTMLRERFMCGLEYRSI